MTNQQFLQQFGHFINAPNGLTKLRELLLQLAIQGKLVPQNPEEESALILLDKIKKRKAECITDKIYSKLKKLPSEEIPDPEFALPTTWQWALLDDLTYTVHYGYTASADRSRKDIRLLRITDIQNNRVNWDSVPGCEITDKKFKSNALNENDILIARTGGTIGKTYIVENLTVKAVFASYLIRAVPSAFMNPKYLKLYMETPLYWRQLYAKSAGTGQPNVNATSLRALQVPVPPLAEQHRIVARVDELMAICDQLETEYKARDSTYRQLILAVHPPLVEAVDSKAAQLAWHRIRDNFTNLYITLDSVQALRQTILQLAMTGKLTPQDRTDDPASELLNNISIKKNELINAGKIKKQKSLPPLSSEEVPSKVPSGWECVRLQDVTNLITDGKHGDCNNLQNSGYYFLSAKDIQNGRLVYDGARQIEPSEFQEVHQRTDLEPLDICMVNTGATVGKIAIATDNDFTSRTTFQKSVAVIKPAKPFIDTYYLALFLTSETANFLRKSGGSAINNLLLGDLKKKAFMLPPLTEQHRIVAKVNELMAVCDQLETNIKNQNDTATHYAEAIVHQIATA